MTEPTLSMAYWQYYKQYVNTFLYSIRDRINRMNRATQYQYYRYCISVGAPTKDPRISEDKDIKANAIIKSLAKDGVNGELAYLKGKIRI